MSEPTKWTKGPWVANSSCIMTPSGDVLLACVLGALQRKDDLEDYATAARIVDCVNALQGIANPQAVAGLVEAAKEARTTIQAVLQRAYNSAGAVCCRRPVGGECCGSPDPEWSEYDQQIMAELGPVEKALTEALAALEQEKQG